MSKGIGRTQALLLRALASLEAQDGRSLFYVWAIADRCFELSQPLQARAAAGAEAYAKSRAWWKEQAAAGNPDALLFESLGRALARRPGPRQRRKAPYRDLEYPLNPSRALASLAKRGLVQRVAVQGGGSAGLTDAGRDAARQVLSVGSSCANTRVVRK